jgi:hypothetical protein
MENKDVGDLARDYYLKGFGCSESILHAFKNLGRDTEKIISEG